MRSLLVALLFAVPTAAADWPHFLGPTRDNFSPVKVTPWKGDLKPLWKVPVGEAHSSPVVVDGTVYCFFKPTGLDMDALVAFDARTGKRKWGKAYERATFSPPFGEGPRGTPCVSGGKVYTFGNTGVLACWDATTGDLKWKADLLTDLKAPNLLFGISTSPVVVGKFVIVMVGGKGAGLVAVETETGKIAWRSTDDPASYATPIIIDEELVTLTGSNVRAVGVADGKEKWAFPFKDDLNESSTTPVKAGDLFIASSVTAGSVALRIRDGQAERVWADKSLTCYFSTPVAVGQYLYMVNGSVRNPSIVLRCVEARTGKVVWEKPNIGKYHAALIRTADEKLLMMDDAGKLTLIQPDEKQFRPLATAKLCAETWAHPAIADGRLYIRDNTTLYCFRIGEE